MRETIYDFPYIKTLDAVEMIEQIQSITYKRGGLNDYCDEYTVTFSDGNTLKAEDQFTLIRMINAYLKYMLNDDVVKIVEN
jgi:hypothetical protein